MLQQRRNSRRFVLSELQKFGQTLQASSDDAGGGTDRTLLSVDYGGGGVGLDAGADAGNSADAEDSDDQDDGYVIQLEPMTPQSPRFTFGDVPLDDRPPSMNEILQWKSIKNLQAGIT